MPEDEKAAEADTLWQKIRKGYARWRELTKPKKKKKPGVDTGRVSPRPVRPQPNAEQLKAIANGNK